MHQQDRDEHRYRRELSKLSRFTTGVGNIWIPTTSSRSAGTARTSYRLNGSNVGGAEVYGRGRSFSLGLSIDF